MQRNLPRNRKVACSSWQILLFCHLHDRLHLHSRTEPDLRARHRNWSQLSWWQNRWSNQSARFWSRQHVSLVFEHFLWRLRLACWMGYFITARLNQFLTFLLNINSRNERTADAPDDGGCKRRLPARSRAGSSFGRKENESGRS